MSIKDLFNDAVQLDGDERAAFLDRATGDDVELRGQVERLLCAHEASPAFLSEATGPGLTVEKDEAALDQPIDRYVLLRRIGEGGFGQVFLARQESPIQREVAIKILKAGMDARQIVRRFDAERRILAVMDHAGIARIFDGGSTRDGRPYFAMEYVRGRSIAEYCREEGLELRARVELAIEVCRAVQHAHQKGVIHRDLKPANVLVTLEEGRPRVKVIDFGIAKAIADEPAEATQLTLPAQFVGTPAYMSPEQMGLSAVDVDTRSDVYSLGALLYEMLTGRAPFDSGEIRRVGIDEFRRWIREVDPPRPSERASGSDAAKLRGDLDWVVMKCLEKDPARRYDTVAALALDLERFLTHVPTLAAPPDTGYRLRKFLRRNRRATAVASLLGLVLLLGSIGTAWQAARATRERDRARKVNTLLERFLIFPEPNNTFALTGTPPPSFRPDVRLIEIVDEAERSMEAELAGQPDVESDVRFALGRSFLGLCRMFDSNRQLTRALELRRELYGDDDPRTLDCLAALGWARFWIGRYDEAEESFRGAATGFAEEVGASDDRTTCAQLGLAIVASHRPGAGDEPIRIAQRALAARRARYPEASREVAMAHVVLAQVQFTKRCAGVAEVVEDARRSFEAAPVRFEGDEYWMHLMAGNRDLICATRADEAVPHFLEAVRCADAVTGPESFVAAQARKQLALALFEEGRASEALPWARESAAAFTEFAGPGHPYVLEATLVLARSLRALGEPDEARERVAATVEAGERAFGPDHDNSLQARIEMAWFLAELGRDEEAAAVSGAVVERFRRRGHRPPLAAMAALRCWAGELDAIGREAESQSAVLEALQLYETLPPDSGLEDESDVHWLLDNAGSILAGQKEFARAEPLLARAFEIRVRTLGPHHELTLLTQTRRGWCLGMIGRREEGAGFLREATAGLRTLGSGHVVRALLYSAVVARELGAPDEADALFRDVVSQALAFHSSRDPVDVQMLAYYGDVLRDEGRLEEAELLLHATDPAPR